MRNHTDMISRRDLLKAMEAAYLDNRGTTIYRRVGNKLVPITLRPTDKDIRHNFHLSTLKK